MLLAQARPTVINHLTRNITNVNFGMLSPVLPLSSKERWTCFQP